MRLIREIGATADGGSSNQLASLRRVNEEFLDEVIRRAQYFADHPKFSDVSNVINAIHRKELFR